MLSLAMLVLPACASIPRLPASAETSAFSLRFEIAPPSADATFVVIVNGLANNGQPVDPPHILFTKGRAWSFQAGL